MKGGGFLLFVFGASLASVLGPKNGVHASKADVTCPSGRSHSEQVVTPDEGERSQVHAAASGLNFALTWVEDSQVKLAFQQDSVEFGSATAHSVSDLNDTECEEPRVTILSSDKLVSTFTCDGVAYSRSWNLSSDEWDETQVIFNSSTDGNSSVPTDEEEEDEIDAESAILITQDIEDGETFFCASLANDSATVKCAVLSNDAEEGGNVTWQEVDTTSFHDQLASEQEEDDDSSADLVFTAASDEEGKVLFVYVLNSTSFGAASLESGELIPISSELHELNSTEDVEIDRHSISLSSNAADSFVLVISLGEKGIYATSTEDFGETWSELVKLSSKEVWSVSTAYTDQFVVAYEDEEGIHGFTFTNETFSGNNDTDNNSTIPEEPSNSTYEEDPHNNSTFEEPETVLLLQDATEPVLVGSQKGTPGYLLAGLSDDSQVVAIGCYSTPRPTTAPSDEEEPTFSPSTNETTSPPPTNDDNETTVSPSGSLSPTVSPSESSFTQSPSVVNSTVDVPPPHAAASGATSLYDQGWRGLGAAMAVLSLSWVVM